MKLRNKKTGKIIDLDYWTPYALGNEIGFENEYNEEYHYNSLAELYVEWEDYEEKEPLIKDEKIRKAVRAWMEANGEEQVKVKGRCLVTEFKGLHKMLCLELACSWSRDGIYTIAELCGEEE